MGILERKWFLLYIQNRNPSTDFGFSMCDEIRNHLRIFVSLVTCKYTGWGSSKSVKHYRIAPLL
ncbi:hypothetical protein BW892_06555 [Bacillus cereus]|uniref:Uncharacterized protein n=1 Tax=Bacillus cereus TaxID=1396 RepID=A0A1S9V7N2_BACCE|nr:hypothetical protein BW892_06555 [Bacillus cereus]